MKNITGKTKVLGVIGWPIEHSLSPAMHNAAIEKLRVDYTYDAFLVHPGDLSRAVAGMRGLGIQGLNVTIPHKEKIMAYLDEIDPLALKIGAVNTVVRSGNILKGYNTDAPAFIKSLGKSFKPAGKTVFVYGAGGAAKAIAHALAESGAANIFVTDMDRIKSRELALKLGKTATVIEFLQADIAIAMAAADMLVNVSPVGMRKGDPCPVAPECLHERLFVYDVIYNRETELIRQAKKRKLSCMDGAEMFVHQGAIALEYWTGKKAPVAVMTETVRKEVKRK